MVQGVVTVACEDFPCCGHEAGDCEGLKYGSSEDIQARVREQWNGDHAYCDHEFGIYNCGLTTYDSEGEVDEDEDWVSDDDDDL